MRRSVFRVALPALSAVSIIALGGAAALAQTTAQTAAADLILMNGAVWTANEDQSWAEAVAVSDGRIVYVGDDDGIAPFKGEQTRIIDLESRMLVPGFIDGHNHVSDAPEELFWLNTRALGTIEEIGEALLEFRAQDPDMQQLRAIGWNEDYVLQEAEAKGVSPKELLDQYISDIPVIVLSNGHHDMWVNSRALENAEIDENTPTPEGAVIQRIPGTPGLGEPNGLVAEFGVQTLIEAALPFPEFTAEQFREGILTWQDKAAERGVTSVLVPQPRPTVNFYEALQELDQEGGLTAQYDIGIWANEHRGTEQLPEFTQIRDKYQGDLFTIDTIKFFGTGGAGLVWEQDVLEDTVAALDELGFRIFVHIISSDDDARNAYLDAFEQAMEQNGQRDARHTISHTGAGSPEVAARFAELGVIADGHPVPPVYFDAGVPASSSSDYPVREFWPLTRVEAGVKLSEDEAEGLERYLRSHTINGAHLIFSEDEIGSIEVGKRADLVVLEKNLFDIPVEEIDETLTLMTFFNGEELFRHPSMEAASADR